MSSDLVFQRDTYDLPLLLFERSAVDRGLSRWRHIAWRTEASDLSVVPDVVFSFEMGADFRAIRLEREGCVAFVSLTRQGHVESWLAASEEAVLDSLRDELHRLLPTAPDEEAGRVPVRFWTLKGSEPTSVVRTVAVPGWTDVRTNYTGKVSSVLDRLMELRHPPRGGQLMLWHGRTGTGKTSAIRALLLEWRQWARAEYIVDPEQFFAGPAGYLMSVLLGGEDEEQEDDEKWRLLVIEDTGELLSADAKERVGQGLSRFLNTVDGLLGQGLKVLLLITTNEDLGKLHPAVTRPGRCAVNLRFTELERGEAAAWLAQRGESDPTIPARATLAELFAVVDEREISPDEPGVVGFRRD